MRTFEEVQDELRECIGHAYRDEAEDIQEFGGNIEHLDKATHLLNELIEIHKASTLSVDNTMEWVEDGCVVKCSACGSPREFSDWICCPVCGKKAVSSLSENKEKWIYDKGINNWRCSKCGQTPPPTGYVGNADFMATYFKFCNHCGADMRGVSE